MLEIKVVENLEELMQSVAVRAIVYIHEQKCPYKEEFDLNDFTSTQIIGTLNGEPIMCGRIRYFGGMAKLERLAIRKEYRGEGYGHKLLEFMIGFCEKKGFSEIYLHAQKRLEPFYSSYGFKTVGQEFAFSNYDYLEMKRINVNISLDSSIASNPMLINRPENNFEKPGPLERNELLHIVYSHKNRNVKRKEAIKI